MRNYFIVAVLLLLNVTLYAQDNGDKLFDNSYLHEIRFEWTATADLWDTLSTSYALNCPLSIITSVASMLD